VLHHSTPFHSFLLGNLETLVRMRKEINLNTHPGPPRAGSGPGAFSKGGRTWGKSEKTQTASNARWPLAESTVNTTKLLRHHIGYCRKRQKHTQHSWGPGLGNLYRLPPPFSTAQYTPMKMAERYSRTRLPSTCDI
jgi:hypothetical protein